MSYPILLHKQRFKHDPANGVMGDCHRTVLACILRKELDDVPHFLEGLTMNHHEEFNRRVAAYLRSVGYVQSDIYFHDLPSALHATMGGVIGIIGGQSHRGVNHSWVAYDGAIIHDPSHDESLEVAAPLEGMDAYGLTLLVPIQY